MHKRHLAALAAAIVAAGCGGSDDSSGTPGLTNFATGPVPSSPSVGAVASKTMLPSTGDTHEVETDGTWVVWKARQINVGYYNGSSYANLNLGLSGAVTPWAFDDCERSPIAFDGSRIAFIANDVGSAEMPAFYFGAPGSTMRKIALPDTVTTKMPQYYGVTIYGNAAGFADMNVVPARLYRVDLSAASPAFVEVTYTGSFTDSPPGLGLVPLQTADGLALLDISDGTARALTGDGVAGTPAYQVRFANGAFTWIENNRAYFYAPGFSPGDDSQLIADFQNATSSQSYPVAGPYNTYVMWQEYDSNNGVTTVKQRPWGQLGMTPNGGTILIRNHQALLWDAIDPIGGLSGVQTGMGFIAWLGADTNGDVQLFTYFVGQPVPSPLEIQQVTSDAGSGWGNSDSVFLFVDGSKVFFKQEFTDIHSPGRVLKVHDYVSKTTTAILDGREFQQLPLMLVANGKVVTLTRDHSFRLFAKQAGAGGAPVVVTPQSYDVKTFDVVGGQLVFAALDREIYLDDDFLMEYVDNSGAESLIEAYALKLAEGGSPQRLTYNAQEEYAPTTDGTWAAWRDEDNYAFALNLATGVMKWIGEASGEIRLDGGMAAWQDNGSYVRYANLATGESELISSGSAWFCPSIAGGIITWVTGSYIGYPAGYSSAAYYYDLNAETPAETLIAGAKPGYMNSGTYYYYPVPSDTDGRYITWVEARQAWDDDGDGGVTTPAVDANVVVVYDVTTDTSDVVPAADFAQTGYGLYGGNEGPVCNPKIDNGLVVFGAVEYGVDNPDQDNEVFFYDVAAGGDVVRVTDDPEGEGLWDSRVRVGGNLAVFRSGGASYWDWYGMVPAVARLK